MFCWLSFQFIHAECIIILQSTPSEKNAFFKVLIGLLLYVYNHKLLLEHFYLVAFYATIFRWTTVSYK